MLQRSPNTVRAYAHDLRDFFVFLGWRELDWGRVRLEDIGEFVAWLRLPPPGRAGIVAVLPSAGSQVSAATINRKLAAVSAFYAHQARSGADVGDLLARWQAGGRGGWKPFLRCSTGERRGTRLEKACRPFDRGSPPSVAAWSLP